MKNQKLKLLSAVVVALCFSAAPAAQATILSNYLTFDGPQHTGGIPFQGGGEDKLQDDSLTAFVDIDESGGISTGDNVYGMVTLSEVFSSGRPSVGVGATQQVAILFSAMFGTQNLNGSWNMLSIGNSGNAYDLRNAAFMNSTVTAPAGLSDNSIAIVVSSENNVPPAAADPLNWTTGQFSTDFSVANGWNWESTLGLVSDADFFQFMGNLALGGTERGGFTITSQAFAITDWLPVDVLDYNVAAHLNDATLDIGSVNIASIVEQQNGWTFRDQSSYFVNPIPEPETLALLGIGLLGIGVSLRKRKAV